jgi:hypothetical protein
LADESIFDRVGGWFRGDGQRDVTDAADADDVIQKAVGSTQTLGSNLNSAADLQGYSYSLPERKLNLIGQARFDEYDRMVRDVTIVAAGVRLFLNLIANAVWTVNPPEGLNGNEAPVAQGYADAAYDMLFGMTTSWSSVIRKIAMFRLQGFSVMEWTAKRMDDGSIGLLDIEHRPQRSIVRWKRDRSGTIEAVVQRVTGLAEVELPRGKIVYAVDDLLTDNPEGMGLFRHLAETADRLKLFLDLEETGFTTDLRGIPVARAPLGEMKKEVEDAGAPDSPERKKAEARRSMMLRPLRDFIEKHVRNKKTGLMLPSDPFTSNSTEKGQTPSATPKWALELLNGESTSFDSMANAVKRMNEELARVLGVEHLLLGSDGAGSLALARSKVGTFFLTVTSTLLDLVEVVDRDVLTPIADLNGWPEQLRPQMGVNEISDRDIEQVLTALKDLATAGAPLMPDDPAVGEVYDLLGLTRPPERVDEMDLSLTPGRTDQVDPDDPVINNPEDRRIAKVLRSRRNMAKRRMRR